MQSSPESSQPQEVLRASIDRPFALVSRFSGLARFLKEQSPKGVCTGEGGHPDLSPRLMIALSHVVMLAPISVTDLATHLGISLATASQMVAQLSQSGFVIRKEDPTDHRRTLVSLSHIKGGDAARTLARMLEPLDRAIDSLGSPKFVELLERLDELLGYLNDETGHRSPLEEAN